jgi:hypothetical protein
MTNDPDILRLHLDRLVELSMRASPEDRARIKRTIELVAQARHVIGQARWNGQRAWVLLATAKALAQRFLRFEASPME